MARPITYDPGVALDRAMDLFWTRGYRDVSVDDVVQDTGLNRHSLYANYGSKYGLLEAALDQYIQYWRQSLVQVLHSQRSARERIRDFLDLRCPKGPDPYWSSMQERGCLALKLSGELRKSHPEIHARVAAAVAWMTETVTNVIREGQEQGELGRHRTAESMGSVICGGFVSMLYLEPTTELRDSFLSTLD